MRGKRDNAGFTLLEILMVLVIVAVLLSMVSLVAPLSPERQARVEAGRLVQVLRAARESAVLEGREYGLLLKAGEYQLQRLQLQEWRPYGEPHALPEPLVLNVQLSGIAVELARHRAIPQLLALSSDEYTPFEVAFEHRGLSLARVRSDGFNEPVIDEH